MNSSKKEQGSDLGPRLRTLAHQYQQQSEIWDIGCDHGHLGLSFQANPFVKSIHLVDPSAAVIDTLKETIKGSYTPSPNLNLSLHHSLGQNITLSSETNCLFIAGMGGKEMRDIIVNLLPQMNRHDRLVISPHRWILELRAWLRGSELGLVREIVTEENGRFYQVWVLEKYSELPKISLYGEEMWHTDLGRRYLASEVKVYRSHRDDLSRAYLRHLEDILAVKKD